MEFSTRDSKTIRIFFTVCLVSAFLAAQGNIYAKSSPTSGSTFYKYSPLSLNSTTPGCKTYHTIRSGESLNTIAQKYDVLFKKLIQANNISRPFSIYVYQVLCIPDTPQKYKANIPYEAKLPAADFTFQYTGSTLVIKAVNFPSKGTYYVRVGGLSTPTSAKIGLFKSGKGGSVTRKYYLMKPWNNTTLSQVCLKDAHHNTLICRVVMIYYPPIPLDLHQ